MVGGIRDIMKVSPDIINRLVAGTILINVFIYALVGFTIKG